MKLSGILSALVLTAAVASSAAVAQAGTTVKTVRAAIAPAVEGDAESGYFRLSDVERNGAVFQTVTVFVRGLPALATPDSHFEVVLTKDAQQADLGALNLAWKGTRGWLRVDTRKGALVDGATDLTPFSGGTAHITMDGVDVATAAIPEFVAPEGPAGTTTDGPPAAVSFGYGTVVLGDTTAAGKGPVAKLAAFAGNGPGGVTQAIGVAGFGFTRGATYTVVLTGTTQDTLGTFKASSFFGWGGFLVSTRRGDTIPGGSVSGLAGRGVEIRDESGVAVLTATFPSLN